MLLLGSSGFFLTLILMPGCLKNHYPLIHKYLPPGRELGGIGLLPILVLLGEKALHHAHLSFLTASLFLDFRQASAPSVRVKPQSPHNLHPLWPLTLFSPQVSMIPDLVVLSFLRTCSSLTAPSPSPWMQWASPMSVCVRFLTHVCLPHSCGPLASWLSRTPYLPLLCLAQAPAIPQMCFFAFSCFLVPDIPLVPCSAELCLPCVPGTGRPVLFTGPWFSHWLPNGPPTSGLSSLHLS